MKPYHFVIVRLYILSVKYKITVLMQKSFRYYYFVIIITIIVIIITIVIIIVIIILSLLVLSFCIIIVIIYLMMSDWKLPRPKRSNDLLLVAVEDMLQASHGVEGLLIAVISVVPPHACDVPSEGRKRSPYKSVSVGSNNLFDHSDVVLINVIRSQQGLLLIVGQEPNSEVFSEGLEERLVLLVSRDVKKRGHIRV